MLALSYTAALTRHALVGNPSDCHSILSPCVDSSCNLLLALSTHESCGFPLPGKATGMIYVSAKFTTASDSRVHISAAWLDEVRVDGRPLAVRSAKNITVVDGLQANPDELGLKPNSMQGYDGNLETSLVVTFSSFDMQPIWTGERPPEGVDSWIAFVDRKDSLGAFDDDRYWLGGPSIAGRNDEYSREFALFEPTCRRNPQRGALRLSSPTGKLIRSAPEYLLFRAECNGEGYVVAADALSFSPSGSTSAIDLLGWPSADALEPIE